MLLRLNTIKERLSQINNIVDVEVLDYKGSRSIIKCTFNCCGHHIKGSYHNLIVICKNHKCKLTTQDIHRMLYEASQDRYSFKIDTYQKMAQKIDCQCNKCGYKWSATLISLLYYKSGCRKCNGSLTSTVDEAIQKLNVVAQGRYTFKISSYKNAKQKVECVCDKCNYNWCATYTSLLHGRCGCPRCANRLKPTLNEVVKNLQNIYKGRLTFELTEYKNINQKVKCKCSVCGYKWITSCQILLYNKAGCKLCSFKNSGLSQRLTQDIAISRLNEVCLKYNFIWEFKDGSYKTARTTRVICKCNKCHCEWETTYNNIVYKHTGCPNLCYKQQSKVSTPEHEITDFIKQNFPQLEIQQSVKSVLKNPQGNNWMELDIYIPELKLAIEYNGTYWHSDEVIVKNKSQFTSAQQYHNYKTEQCALNGIKLIHIHEQDYKKRQSDVLKNIQLQIQEQI